MTGAIMSNLCAPFTLYNFWEAYPPSVYSYEEVVTFYAIWSLDTRDHITPRWLICLIDQLLTDMDKDHMSGLVFVNWQKAFDLTDRAIILSKLEAYRVPYGIYGAPPTWGLFEG